jgi:YHS domain-containing protein
MARGMMSVAALALALSLSGPVLAKRAAPKKVASKAVTCPVCHMALTTKKTKTRPQGVMIGGKIYYCCAGCDMLHAKGNRILQGG